MAAVTFPDRRRKISFKDDPEQSFSVLSQSGGVPTLDEDRNVDTVVNSMEENRVLSQVAQFFVDAGQALGLVKLADGGVYDHLLEKGRCEQLHRQLSQILKNEPADESGRSNGRTSGLACNIANYDKQVFSPNAVWKHLMLAKEFWERKPEVNVSKIQVPSWARVFVVGDVHGSLEDVLWIFLKYGRPSPTNMYIFNGNLIDRGGHSLEILLLLFAYKRDFPGSVHIIRGSHEDETCANNFGFKKEIGLKYPKDMQTLLNVCCKEVFPLLPLAALVEAAEGNRRFAVLHGGIPVDVKGLDKPLSLEKDLIKIDRCRSSLIPSTGISTEAVRNFDRDSAILWQLLWNDPKLAPSQDDLEFASPEKSQTGKLFSYEACQAFCQENQVSCIMRSHQLRTRRGVATCFGGEGHQRCYTIFSASDHRGTTGNRGGVVLCGGNLKSIEACEHWAPPWRFLERISEDTWDATEEVRQGHIASWEDRHDIPEHCSCDALGVANRRPTRKLTEQVPKIVTSVSVRTFLDSHEQFVMEKIVEHKRELFDGFAAVDRSQTGFLAKDKWNGVMATVLGPKMGGVLTTQRLEDLSRHWGFRVQSEPISYVRFLHRFQIQGDEDTMEQPDLLRAVSMVRKDLSTQNAVTVEALLDPDGDRMVSYEEFAEMIPQVLSTPLPKSHCFALYDQFTDLLGTNPLTLDSVILCISIVSRDMPPPSEFASVAEELGGEILSNDLTFAAVFRLWDTDRTGVLSKSNLSKGLKELGVKVDIVQFMDYLESMSGSQQREGHVTLLEFVRACAPRDICLKLSRSLVQENMKSVWMVRPRLAQLFEYTDPRREGSVTVAEFRRCLTQACDQLHDRLSENQLDAIVDGAAGGRRRVDWDLFLATLHVVDSGAGGRPSSR